METLARSAPAVGGATERHVRPAGCWGTQAALAAVGAYVCVAAGELGVWTDAGPGPGCFPLVLGASLIVLSAVWFLQTPRREAPSSALQRKVWRTGGVTIASLVILGAVLDLVGFQIAMTAFLLFQLRWRGKVGWLTSVVISVVGSVGTFHLFGDLLLVPLPVASLPLLSALGL
jgi:hypothetical protein